MGVGKELPKREPKKLARKLAAIVGGHHGFFPSRTDISNLDSVLAGTDENSVWRKHSLSIFQQLRDFVELQETDLPYKCDNAAAMLLAGLTTISDWLASNPEEKSGFPYANDIPFDEYTKDLREKAKRALEKQGWTQHRDGKPLSFSELFGFDAPRDLQKAGIELAKHLSPPCLILVEASMGEGKTELALYLADYLQHQTSVGGFYIGLPTQATSNAMFQRVQEFLGKRYSDEAVNLTLSHSAAALKEEYLQTVCRLDQVYDREEKVVASEWHTARKRSLLSPYGVGTVDQGLMGVVRSRHQFVRLFGLAGRTVILDEIHAYDLYTGTLLERFLEWLALLGSPVIALSATLPQSTRQGLLNAYAQGAYANDSGVPTPDLPDTPYPRITAFANGAVTAKSFPASEHVCRKLGISWITDKSEGQALQKKLADGGCAAVICSTVARAQEVYERLQVYFKPGDELGLFHGRFLFTDRERIEKECLDKFGKKGKRPARYVLVATQVIEQSLDVDFDLMISDLAPVDLLLQRSGRLHRHTRDRPKLLKTPELWIFEPTIGKGGKADFRESGYIYDRHILLRSWLTLSIGLPLQDTERTMVKLPEETDGLIASVYTLDISIPGSLDSQHQEDWQESLADYQAITKNSHWAKADAVKIPPARDDIKLKECTTMRDSEKKEDDESAIAAVTRLGEPSVTTIFLQRTDQGLCLPNDFLRFPTGDGQSPVEDQRQPIDLDEKPDLHTIRQLLAHSTRISKPDIVTTLSAESNPKTWTSALLRNCRHLELNADGKVDVGKWWVILDPRKGVMFAKKE